MENIYVIKRDGSQEAVDLDKIHRVLEWAGEGLEVSVSQVEMDAQIQLHQGIKTSDIHNTLIKAAADLISAEDPDYQYMAARLAMFAVRKVAYGRYTPPHLKDHVKALTATGKYDKLFLQRYTSSEWDELNSYLDHDRDLTFSYAGAKQLIEKYLVQDRVTRQVYESPQVAYMLISAWLFNRYPEKTRLKYVKSLYDAISTFKISLPTPIMAGVRTPSRQFSSCVLIESGDSLDSISEAARSIIRYVSQKAGIGLNVGAIRALGRPIRNGEAEHTGMLPFLRYFQSAVKSCSQGGVRGGAATTFYPMWHKEFESLIVLKNNRGVEENRVRQLDYGVQINGYLYQKLINQEDIHFFSPDEVPGLYDAFFADQAKFAEIYEAAVANPKLSKVKLPAVEAFTKLILERSGTGRIYIQNVDHCNSHSPFDPAVSPIRQSNLCLEIALPTQPVKEGGQGEVALCTLAAFNLAVVNTDKEIDACADLVVRALDELLDLQDYPLPQAWRSVQKYRPLGVGVINYATFLAERGFNYSSRDGNNATHELMESIQYHLMKASMKLAREKEPCKAFPTLKLAKGILPIDTYRRQIDEVHTAQLRQDWEQLRQDIVQYGVRHSTVTALMPSETSSQLSNATNGIEPPRDLVTVKQSKDGIFKQVVPGIGKLEFETYWQMVSNGQAGYLEKVGIFQKFVDQAISANTGYDPNMWPNQRVPVEQMLRDLLIAYMLGLKTLYYHNTRDSIDAADDDSCSSGACKI